MEFSQAVSSCLKKNYATFQGRAPRSEYWWFALATILIHLVIQIAATVVSFTGIPMLPLLFSVVDLVVALALLLPSLSVSVRRLHDVNRSGWWLLIGMIPLIGTILLLVWICSRGTIGPNRFGDDPLGYDAPFTPSANPSVSPN